MEFHNYNQHFHVIQNFEIDQYHHFKLIHEYMNYYNLNYDIEYVYLDY